MHNAQTVFMTVMGALFLQGLKLICREFGDWVRSWTQPMAQAPATVQWTYCIAGDHMARSDHMAWYGEAFLCDECVRGGEQHVRAQDRSA